jgi:acetyl coenzyme A synthetase (ADP forming)-like protein
MNDQGELGSIRYFFEPRSVAVLGASRDPDKVGSKLTSNILSGGYGGKVYLVNPRGGEISGLPVYQNVTDIDDELDLACIAVPARNVFDTVRSCAEKGVKFVVIISSGFAEVGNREQERAMVDFAREHGVRILGPNVFGLYSASVSLNATFGPPEVLPGGVGIITQSGALGIAMIGKTAVEHVGLSAIVSVGNKADLDETDLLAYLARHEQTTVILMYMEGVTHGEQIIASLKRATRVKPVVVIKSGRSRRGAIAAASHTGSMAGADEVFDKVMSQCGVLRAENIQDAFNWCKFLCAGQSPEGKQTVIVTNGGGVGVLATDACDKYGVELLDDQQHLANLFEDVVPSFGSIRNPIDLTGQAGPAEYERALNASLRDDGIHSVVGLYCETALFTAESLERMIRGTCQQYRDRGKPLVFSIFGGEEMERCLDTLRRESMPVYSDVYQAVSCLGVMYRHHAYLHRDTESIDEAEIDFEEIARVIGAALNDGRKFLFAHEGYRIMKLAGMEVPDSRLARNVEQALKAADTIGYPVVMKIVSRDITHKSDAGGIALGLENGNEVVDAYQAIMASCREYRPDAALEGVEVAQMAPKGTEIIVGARRDPFFGPIVLFGMGGIYVEVMKDVTMRAVPLNREQVTEMIKEIKGYPLLLGVRGEAKKDIPEISRIIIKLATIIRKCPHITDIELNPVMVYEQGKGARAVDVRILVETPGEGEAYG